MDKIKVAILGPKTLEATSQAIDLSEDNHPRRKPGPEPHENWIMAFPGPSALAAAME
jgi:hypothetical protein